MGVGAAKLAEEITDRHMQRKHAIMSESINYLTRQIDSTSNTAVQAKDVSDSRFFKIDRKLSEIDQSIEDDYDSLAKKMVSLENRISDHSKLMLEIAKRQEAIKEKLSERPVPARIEPRQITVPSVVQEKKTFKFELPKIAPKAVIFRPDRKAKKIKVSKPKPASKTIINIAAPKPQVIKKIIKVQAKPKKAKKSGRRIVSGSTIINIAAPKTAVKKVVKVKSAASKPFEVKALKRKAPKKVKTKKASKNISINIS